MDIALLLFIISSTAPLILYKRALLIPNLDIICSSFLKVLLVNLYYAFSIVYTPSNYIAILGGYSIGEGHRIKSI